MPNVAHPQPGPPPHYAGAGTEVWFWEWYFSVYPLDRFLCAWTTIGVTLAVGANTTLTANLQVNIPFFCTAFRSKAVLHSNGTMPTIPYRIGLRHSSGNDWTNGQWMSDCITGDGRSNQSLDLPFPLPREIAPTTQFTVEVDNNVNAAATAIDVDAILVGWEPRSRQNPVQRDQGGQALSMPLIVQH